MSTIGSVKTFPVTTAANADYRDTGIETGGSTYCSLKTIAPRKGRYFFIGVCLHPPKVCVEALPPSFLWNIYKRDDIEHVFAERLFERHAGGPGS